MCVCRERMMRLQNKTSPTAQPSAHSTPLKPEIVRLIQPHSQDTMAELLSVCVCLAKGTIEARMSCHYVLYYSKCKNHSTE